MRQTKTQTRRDNVAPTTGEIFRGSAFIARTPHGFARLLRTASRDRSPHASLLSAFREPKAEMFQWTLKPRASRARSLFLESKSERFSSKIEALKVATNSRLRDPFVEWEKLKVRNNRCFISMNFSTSRR